MNKLTDSQVAGKVLDHHGLVSAAIEQLDLVKKIDLRLPVSEAKGSKVSMGRRVAAMILNGLGFVNTRLYMFPEFLSNKPVERLLGADLSSDDFNDDVLGRCLDSIHNYGPTKLFSDLAFEVGLEKNLLGKSAHLDTSSLSVYGSYNEISTQDNKENQHQTEGEHQLTEGVADTSQNPSVTYGYSKDHRPDLKQMVINLATTGANAFPIWFESHSGNASDKKVLHESAQRMKAYCEQLKGADDFLYVADSAMYESCVKEKSDLLWLSRVPERHSITKDLLSQPDEDFFWVELDKGYRQCIIETQYKNIHQRWCIVSSDQAFKRESATLDRNISKEKEEQSKRLWHLGNREFKCEGDAEKEKIKFEKSLKYYTLDASIVPIKKHQVVGKPKKGVEPKTVGYQIKGELVKDEQGVEKIRRRKGRFILATNQLNRDELADDKLLKEYKEQSGTEAGFKFIKGNTFELSSIFLKSPSRISSLMMIMALCLMVYGYAQQVIRKSLIANNESVPDQKGQPTKKPTLQRVFRFFEGVQVLTINAPGLVQTLVINVSELCKQVVGYFGPRANEIYGIP